MEYVTKRLTNEVKSRRGDKGEEACRPGKAEPPPGEFTPGYVSVYPCLGELGLFGNASFSCSASTIGFK